MDGTPSDADATHRRENRRKRGKECKKEALNRASRATAPPKRWAVKIEEIEGERLHVDCPNTEADSEAGREGQNNYHGISVTLARTFSELAEHPGVRARERGRRKTSGGKVGLAAPTESLARPDPPVPRFALCNSTVSPTGERDRNCTPRRGPFEDGERGGGDWRKVIAI